MPMLVTGFGCYEEHGDCSELKRQIYIEKRGLKWVALAFKNYDFEPINEGRLSYVVLLRDIDKYKEEHKTFYSGYNTQIIKR